MKYDTRSLAAGTFIFKLRRWDWFVTFTYPSDCISSRQVEGDVRRWLQRMARLAGSHVVAAVGLEKQIRGACHAHLVVSFDLLDRVPDPADAQCAWWHGEALVEPHNPDRGAAWYIVKKGRWGVIAACDRMRSRCRRRGGCSGARLEVPIP